MAKNSISKVLRDIIIKECANYDTATGMCFPCDKQCIPLMDNNGIISPCKYLLKAGLPLHPSLLTQFAVQAESQTKACQICGVPFVPSGNRQVFCNECASIQKKRKARDRQHMRRLNGV